MASFPSDHSVDSETSPPTSALRFVVLHHTDYGPEHWDLMLEEAGALATWKVYHDPAQLSKAASAGFRIHDHRKFYLDYEGPLSGGRGQVRRVCAGTYQLLRKDDDCWQVCLRAYTIAGTFEFVRRQGDCWSIVKND